MKYHNRKRNNMILLLLVLLGSLGIGYALLTQELTINGTSKVNANSWDVHFENLVPNQNNVTLSTGDVAATIDSTTETDITYTVTLQKPGDFYEFNVDVVNEGTIDGMVGTVTSKLNNVVIDNEHPLPAYLNYSVTYSDGVAIAPNHMLAVNTTETYKVRLEYKADITANQLPGEAQTLTLNFSVNYVQADSNAVPVVNPVSFSTDSWDTVVAAIKRGQTSAYHVGDTKTVELGNSLGTHTLRVANTSTPAECSTAGFSQTACGFVLEFADIITTHRMNPSGTYKGTQYNNGWNVDGWPESSMRDYLNNENDSTSIYNSLPTVIKDAIADTTVVSGHGSTSGEANFTSTDKLYLLSSHEVWEDVDGNTNSGIDRYDTAYNNTRQLDYYANQGVTTSTNAGAIKQRNSSNYNWWLRSAYSSDASYFFRVGSTGSYSNDNALYAYGVAPAFRIA